MDEDVLDRLTRLIPVLIEAAARRAMDEQSDVEPPADVLDPSTRRQIRSALEHLGCRDLYDALGLPRDAPASVIAARADEERQRWMRKAQVTAEKTAWLEIISHAQSHLTSPKARARYDRTLTLEAEETVRRRDRVRPQGPAAGSTREPAAALVEEAARPGDRLRAGRSADGPGLPQAGGGARPRLGGAAGGLGGDGCLPAHSHSGPAPSCQRRLPDLALPQLLGSDRAEPGGAAVGPGPVPALRGLAEVGMPGLPPISLGRRAAVRLRASAGASRAAWCTISRRPSMRFGATTWPRLACTWSRSRSMRPTMSARGTAWPRSGSRRPTSSMPGWPASWPWRAGSWWRPRGPSRTGGSSSIRHRPRSRRPGRR